MNLKKQHQFESVFRTHYRELFLHALSFVRLEEDAEDIVNDVFEYVWDHYERLDTSESLRPFLYTLTRNKCLDFLRHKKTKERFRQYYADLSREMEIDYKDYEDLIAKIMRLIDGLPAQTSTVFRKCFIEKKTYKETGEELGISVNTVRTHISKALRILRGGLSDKEIRIFLFLFKKK